MKAFTIITLTFILSLFISILFVENTYGNGEHMEILSLCLSCAVFAGLGVVGSELHDRFPMTFADVLTYLFLLGCVVAFVGGILSGLPVLTITACLLVVVVSGIKSLYCELKTA